MKRLLAKIGEAFLMAISGLYLFQGFIMLIHEVEATDPKFTIHLPYFLLMAGLLYSQVILHLLLWPSSKKQKVLCMRGNGIGLASVGLIDIVLTVMRYVDGTFRFPIMGNMNDIYPLDVLLFGIAFIVVGVLLAIKGFKDKGEEKEGEVYYPNTRPLWINILVTYFLFPFMCGVITFFVGDLAHFFTMLDLTFKNLAVTIPVYLMMVIPAVMLGFYEYWYRTLDIEAKKNFMVKYGHWLCLIEVIVIGWADIAIVANPLAIPESMTACFPLDFMASKPIGQWFLFALNIIPFASVYLSTILRAIKEGRRK